MAPLFNQHQSPRYSDAARRALGEDLELSTISPEIQTNIIWENDRPEHHAALGQRDWSSTILQIVADATHFGQIDVFNPPGSGMLSVVTLFKVILAAGAAGTLYRLILDGTVAGGAVSAGVFLDTRLVGKTATQFQTGAPDLAIGSQLELDEKTAPGAAANADIVFDLHELVLYPGHRAKIEGPAINTIVRGVMFGYERPLTSTEGAP
jgi:hypothetical protein